MFHKQVRDLMTERVFALKDSHSLCDAYDLMEDHHIHHIPVVSDHFELVGILAFSDIVRATLEAGGNPFGNIRDLLGGLKVADWMIRNPETVSAEDDICEAGRTMFENKLGSLPVVDGTELVGILTRSDFVRFVISLGEPEYTTRTISIPGIRLG